MEIPFSLHVTLGPRFMFLKHLALCPLAWNHVLCLEVAFLPFCFRSVSKNTSMGQAGS